MEVQSDFKELLALFNEHKADYLIVGGYALAMHGAPRFTGDLDLYVRPDPGNASRIMTALTAFGFGSAGLSEEGFLKGDGVVELGVPPVRVDLMTSLSGVEWEEARSGRVESRYGDVSVPVIGKREFVRNKRALGRKRDLADLEALGEE